MPSEQDEKVRPESMGDAQAHTHSEVKASSTDVTDSLQPRKWYQSKRLYLGIGVILLLVLGMFFIQSKTAQISKVPVKQFTHVYTFVPEKLSKSAQIPISLPEGVDELSAQNYITFDPEIKGEWVVEDFPNTVVFEPKEPLREKKYYRVDMDAPGASMSGDFYVDADPVVDAIFPASGSEAHESSEISIVFNRPMVPLTTLKEVESKEIPVTITPLTEGRFKWISTRTLQFIPLATLRPASEYTVTVGDGLTSVDGLAVLPFTHTFRTRPLRYEYISEGIVGYRSPITITFNQAVDLTKTSPRISVTRGDGESIPLEVTYGETTTYDWVSGESKTEENTASLFIYQKQDQHGRERFWDFDTTYTVTVNGGETLTGTIPLTEERRVTVSTPNIVEGVEATSARTSLVRQDFFDPQGTLRVRFYDEVDIKKLDFDVHGFKDVVYGERCKTDQNGNEIQKGNGCEMEPDTRTLIFSFKEGDFRVGQEFTLTLQKVYTVDGQKINADPYTIPLRTYSSFAITKTDQPDFTSAPARVNGITVCSTAPLKDLDEEETLKKYVSTTGYIVYGSWHGSEYIDPNNTWYTGPCSRGEFETNLNYGLLPSTAYTLDLTLTDAFGQTAEKQRSFTTEAPQEQYTRFHNLQQAYNVTRPGRTKLTYAAENLESMNLHICKMSPETFLRRTVDNYASTDAPYDGECIQVVRDTITLPRRYWVNNYFQIDLEKYMTDVRGHYVVTFSSPLYIDSYDKRPLYDRTLVSVTTIAIGKKEVEFSEDDNWSRSQNPGKDTVMMNRINQTTNLYWINDSTTLAPLGGASVTQYVGGYNATFAARTTGVTDGQGIARVPVGNQITGAVVRHGAESAIISDWADTLNYSGRSENASRTYIYTDRPIYRPGQTVYLRGIDRIGFDGAYEIWTKDPVPLTVYDAQGKKIYDTKLMMSQYGTFNSSFELPTDAPLGTYRIEAFGQETYISVEEYVPAAFKLETKTGKDEYINGDTIDIGVQADYYFGVPLSGGTVLYAITAQDYYFDRYTDEYFNFGNNWYTCYSCGYGDSFLMRGEERLNEKGHASIQRTLKLDEYFDDAALVGSKLVTVSITVKDQNGRSVSSQKSFVVHKGSYYLGVRTDEYYTSVNTPVTLRVKSVDLTGKPIAKSDIERTLYKIDWETFKRQEVDGGYYYRSEEKRTEISREKMKTDSSGNWSGTVTPPESGEYEIVVSGEDESGNRIETKTHLYIFGNQAVYVPPNNNYELDLEVEDSNVTVGDTASILIKSPYERAKVLITAERGTVYDYWIVDVVGGLYKHSFTIKEGYAPNVTIGVLLLSPNPEVKFGSAPFTVNSEAHKLTVEVTSDKEHYLPGETVALEVRTTDASGKGASAEVSLAVADLSVLALRGNPKKDPYIFFYDGFPLSVSTASNIKNILYEAEIPLGSKGGGGADPDDLAKKQRGVFKDTAYWNASLETNKDGYGEIQFILPDNLTTWRIESLGVTTDTKLGVDYAEFVTQKELMAIPLKPRFIVPGDTFSLGAHVFNQSEKGEEINVTLESDSLEFLGDRTASVYVDSGESKSVFFEVRAPKTKREGVHTFTVTAEHGQGIDSVKQEINITPNTVYETVATAHFTKDDAAIEYIYIPKEVVSDEGGLTVNANATLAVFMSDALTYMAQYPYGCSEQIASALSTIAMVKRALDVPGIAGSLDDIKDAEGVSHTVEEVVSAGLSRIYETQNAAGGVAYYKGLTPSVHLTIRVALALGELKKAGFTIREGVLEGALTFIENETLSEYSRYPEYNKDTIILAEYVLRTVGDRTSTKLSSIIKSIIADSAVLNEKLNSMSLGYLALLTAEGYGMWDTKRVYDALTNRIDIDGRGAYLTNPMEVSYGYYETSIADTALLLRAFTAHKDNHAMLGNVLRWILSSRDRDGVWGNTQNTAQVVTALVEYLSWQHETESRFTLRAALDGVELFVEKFTPENIFNTISRFVPMQDLKKGALIPLTFERTDVKTEQTNFYYDIALRYYLPAAAVPPRDEGITITRELYALSDIEEKTPIVEAAVGDIVRGKLTLTTPDAYQDVAIEDIIPAGFEIVNFNLDTEDQSLNEGEEGGEYDYYDGGMGFVPSPGTESDGILARALRRIKSVFTEPQTAQVFMWSRNTSGGEVRAQKLYPTHAESHDDRVFLFVDSLSSGVYEYEYFLRALVPGEFQHLPARAEELYFPEIFGRTDGDLFTITPAP